MTEKEMFVLAFRGGSFCYWRPLSFDPEGNTFGVFADYSKDPLFVGQFSYCLEEDVWEYKFDDTLSYIQSASCKDIAGIRVPKKAYFKVA